MHDVFSTLLESDTDATLSGAYLMSAVRNRCFNHICDCDIHNRIAAAYFLDEEAYESEFPFDEDNAFRVNKLISKFS